MIKTLLVSGITAFIVALLFVSLVGDNQSGALGASGSRFPNGISADNTSPLTGEVRGKSVQLDNGSATTSLIVDKVCFTITASDGETQYAYFNNIGSLATTSVSCL